MGAGTKILAIAVAVAVAAAAAWWGYTTRAKSSERETVHKVVGDTTTLLREALAKPPTAELVAQMEANLKAVNAPRNRELADAAEHYVIGAREIARRRADAARLSADAAAARQALAAHMARRSQAPGWYSDATKLKTRVEQLHADLGRTLKAIEDLFYTLPDAQKRLAPHVPASLLLDAAARDAGRKQAEDDAKRATAELERTRSLLPR